MAGLFHVRVCGTCRGGGRGRGVCDGGGGDGGGERMWMIAQYSKCVVYADRCSIFQRQKL